MARSDKVAMCIVRYMVPLMLLFSYAFCCMAAVSDGCGPDESEGK